ncbi:MAG: tetratricopeptide repeat protein [Gammaproteobacteria bacterium]|nr:tetratricopeptide repeat protein [Gammaproteobacteria bacterium]MDH3856635.1 tetratricopeptide repeat protein [Gammaproteobacteria bacterium]
METEEEQVERLKAWLKENGISIVLGIIIGVGGIGGYNYWMHVQETTAAEASSHFAQMMEALSAGNNEVVLEQADTLLSDYESTDYAMMAQLALAKSYVANGEYEKAESALQQVVGSAAQQPLAFVARTRLATVQIQTGRYENALTSLSIDFPEEFAAIVNELRGDVYALQGKSAEAIEAYRKAQTAQPQPANVEFLRQKLNDLGGKG